MLLFLAQLRNYTTNNKGRALGYEWKEACTKYH